MSFYCPPMSTERAKARRAFEPLPLTTTVVEMVREKKEFLSLIIGLLKKSKWLSHQSVKAAF